VRWRRWNQIEKTSFSSPRTRTNQRRSSGSVVALDGGDDRVLGAAAGEPLLDGGGEGVELGSGTRRAARGLGSGAAQSTSGAVGQVAVDPAEPGGGGRPRVVAGDAAPPAPSRSASERRSARTRIGVAANSAGRGVDEEAGAAVLDEGRRPPTAAATTGVPQAAASRATSPKLRAAGHEHDVGGPVVGGQQVVGLGSTKRTRSSHAEAATSSVTRRPRWASPAGPLVPPTTTSTGVVAVELGERPHRDVEALERLDAADEQQHRVVAEAEGRAGAGAVAGREEGVVDAGGTISMRAGSAP
jgi:hypothetical protein